MRTRGVVWFCVAIGIALGGCNPDRQDPADSSIVLVSSSFLYSQPRADKKVFPQKSLGPVGEVAVDDITPRDRVVARELKLSDDGFRSMMYLYRTAFFATSPRAGRNSKFPPHIVAFQRLLREPNANAAFHWLVQAPCSVGGLYGLCGLYFTDPGCFAAEVERFRGCDNPVFVMLGPMGRFTTISEIAFSDSPDAVRLGPPDAHSDTRQLWLWGDDPTLSDCGNEPVLDIYGGGYPCFLRDAKPTQRTSPETASEGPIMPSVRASL